MQQVNGERIFCFQRQAESVSKTRHLLALSRSIRGVVNGPGREKRQGGQRHGWLYFTLQDGPPRSDKVVLI
jgi:hypothetical protein